MKKTKTTNNVKVEDWSPQKVAEYSLLQTAIYDTRHSSRKIIISLSAAGVGLLVGLSNFLSFSSIWQIAFFAFGLICFFMTIIFILALWGVNCKILVIETEQLDINDAKKIVELQNSLNRLHKSLANYVWISIGIFGAAIISVATFSVISIYEKYDSKEKNTIKIQRVQVVGPVQTYPMLLKEEVDI